MASATSLALSLASARSPSRTTAAVMDGGVRFAAAIALGYALAYALLEVGRVV